VTDWAEARAGARLEAIELQRNDMKKHSINYPRVVAVLACLFICQFISAQWPQWRGPERNGSSAETNLLKIWPTGGPRLLWTSKIIGDGFSTAIIQDNVIYVSGKRDSIEVISAIDLKGRLIWQKETGKASSKNDWGESSTPALYKGNLYAVTIPGEIYCIDSKSGILNWKISIPNKFGGISNSDFVNKFFSESPLVVDDKVIITPGGKNTTLAALNYATGETIWKSESLDDESTYSSPVLVQNTEKKLIVTNTKKYLLAIDLNSGKIVWKEMISSTVGSIPIQFNKQVYFSSYDYGSRMLNISDDLSSFNFEWSDTLRNALWGGAVKLGNRIYRTNGNGQGMYALDWEKGTQVFFKKGIGEANLLAADGMIYCYEEKGRISLLKPTDNNIIIVSAFNVTLGGGPNLAHMSIGNGILFVRHGNALMAYDIKQHKI
jgi:outer membrane protein assembly factor BamB